MKKTKLILILGGGTLVLFFVTFFILFLLGLVPESLRSKSSSLNFLFEMKNSKNLNERGEFPVQIVIEKIGVNTVIQNPQSAEISVLDNELRKGAVRYPGSGLLGSGHMFLFGHSTGLPVVINQAYKAFSGLGNLKISDKILIYSEGYEYAYEVSSVRLANANEDFIDLSTGKNMVTISTCDTFGRKQDRFVVDAIFISKKKIR